MRKPEDIVYNHAEVIEAIREHAERHHGVDVERVGWYYTMDDTLRYYVVSKADHARRMAEHTERIMKAHGETLEKLGDTP